eukprot:5255064-Ditylum_brightwellii.AAC.1
MMSTANDVVTAIAELYGITFNQDLNALCYTVAVIVCQSNTDSDHIKKEKNDNAKHNLLKKIEKTHAK